MPKILALVAASVLTACATLPVNAAPDGMATARFGQTVNISGPRVTPLRLLEDSRCPLEARCVWAGQVRIEVRVRSGRGSSIRELILGKPIPVADGELQLASIMPPRSTQREIRLRDYRLGFRFSAGL
jgi:hypothetical protein